MKSTRLRPLAALLCAALLSVSLCTSALAATGARSIEAIYAKYKVTLDGESLRLTDADGKTVEPFSWEDTVYLPVRAIATALGLQVQWLPETQTVALKSGGQIPAATQKAPTGARKTVTLIAQFSGINLTMDGTPIPLKDADGATVEPFTINGTTYLPVRAVADAMGLGVDFQASSNTVALTSRHPAANPKNAAAFLKGVLDSIYLGKYDKNYLSLAGISADWAKEERQDKLDAEALYFARYFDVSSLAAEREDEDTLAALKAVEEFYTDLYAKAKYTVGTAKAGEDGTYLLPVSVSPINTLTRLTGEEIQAAKTAALSKSYLTVKETEALNEEERAALEALRQDRAYTENLVKALRSKGVGYNSKETATVRIWRDEDGYYALRDDDLSQIDSYILAYNRK